MVENLQGGENLQGVENLQGAVIQWEVVKQREVS